MIERKRRPGHPRTKRDGVLASMYLERDTLKKIDAMKGTLSRSVFIERVIDYIWEDKRAQRKIRKKEVSP